jgi:hypothetical protein
MNVFIRNFPYRNQSALLGNVNSKYGIWGGKFLTSGFYRKALTYFRATPLSLIEIIDV